MGTGEGTEITEKGDLIMGKIVMGRGLIGLVPVKVEIVRIHGNLVNVWIVCIHGNPIDIETVHIHGSPINVRIVHVYGSMQTGV